MPRDLFGHVTRPSISIGSRKWYTLPVSLFSHSAAVALLVALPLLAPAIMPAVSADEDPYIVKIAPPPPPLPPIRSSPKLEPIADPNVVPIIAPDSIKPETPIDAGWEETTDAAPGTIEGTFDSSVVAPPAPPPVVQAPVRVGGTIRAPMKVRDAQPVYPVIAQAARVEGIVIIEATIDKGGRIINARILRSVPLLDQAAAEAVRQWEFTPTLLNGVPVPVVMTVTVSFKLTR